MTDDMILWFVSGLIIFLLGVVLCYFRGLVWSFTIGWGLSNIYFSLVHRNELLVEEKKFKSMMGFFKW